MADLINGVLARFIWEVVYWLSYIKNICLKFLLYLLIGDQKIQNKYTDTLYDYNKNV